MFSESPATSFSVESDALGLTLSLDNLSCQTDFYIAMPEDGLRSYSECYMGVTLAQT